MSWGRGIIIAMTGFIGFILYLVFTLMSKNTDLESVDYYKKEIEFQKEITASNNTNALKEKVKVTQDEDFLVIQMPHDQDIDSIHVILLKPNDKNLDEEFNFEGTKNLMIPKKDLSKGKYQLKLHFVIENKKHLYKEDLTIE